MTNSIEAKNLFDLSNGVALVTGAAGYLGRAIAEALAEVGALVILNGRDQTKLEQLQLEFTARRLRAVALPFDITDAAALDRAINQIDARWGRLDVLVNNAHSGRAGGLNEATANDFANVYEIAVTAAHRLSLAAKPLLCNAVTAAGTAGIINIASMYATVSPDLRIYSNAAQQNPPCYGAAKAALLQWTRYAATALGPDQIRVNAISPGPFPNPATVNDPIFKQRLADKVPLGRVGRAEELKTAVLFLASRQSSFVTGANISVDGGWTAW